MQKTTFWKAVKATLATSCVSLLALGCVFANTDTARAEETATPMDVTREGIYGITGSYSYVNSGTTNYNMGNSSVSENFEFVSHVTLAITNKNLNVPIGILLTEGTKNGAGYWFDIQTDVQSTGKEYGYIALYDGAYGGTKTLMTSTYAKSDSEWHDVIYSPSGFDLRFGAQDYCVGGTFSYTHVYVYINDVLFMDGKDESKNDLGNYFGADNGGSRVTFQDFQDAKTGAMTTEDIYDLNPDDGNALTNRGVWHNSSGFNGTLGKTTVTENYEFVGHVKMNNSNANQNFPLKILTSATTYSEADDSGYTFDLKGSSSKLVYFFDGKTNMKSFSFIAPDEWYGASTGFDLRFGARTYYYPDNTFAFTKVYAIVNGEVVFDYTDTTQNTNGSNVTSDAGHGRVTIFAAKGEEAEVVTQDMADVFGLPVLETNVQSNYPTATVDCNANFALKTRIKLVDEVVSGCEEASISLLQNAANISGTSSYHLKIDLTNQQLKLVPGRYGNNAAVTVAIPESWDTGAEIVMGIKDYVRDGNVAYRIVWLESDGETLLRYVDHEYRALGNNVYVEKYNRLALYTTKTTVEEFGVEALGASVKIGSEGIRFVSSVDMATYNALVEYYGETNVELGTVVLPKVLAADENITKETEQAEKIVREVWFDEGDATGLFTGVVSQVPVGYKSVDLYARTYLTVTVGDVEYTWYSKTITRSMESVAEAALADYVADFDETHTEEKYKYEITIEGVTYHSSISAEDREELKAYLVREVE